MKMRLAILLSLLAAVFFSPSANALTFEVNVGDRPYYQGYQQFWDYGWNWVWVPGHMHNHHWVHGYYIKKGNWNAKYVKKRHKWHKWHD